MTYFKVNHEFAEGFLHKASMIAGVADGLVHLADNLKKDSGDVKNVFATYSLAIPQSAYAQALIDMANLKNLVEQATSLFNEQYITAYDHEREVYMPDNPFGLIKPRYFTEVVYDENNEEDPSSLRVRTQAENLECEPCWDMGEIQDRIGRLEKSVEKLIAYNKKS